MTKDDLYWPAFEVRNGEVAVPSDSGWGVEIDPDWLTGAETAESSV